MQNKLIRIMIRVGLTHACRDLFIKLGILPIPCVYVLSLMMFLVNNFDKFQINNSIHKINTRINYHLHSPITHLSSYWRDEYYSGVKLFNILLPKISTLKSSKTKFRIALQNYLLSNSLYSIEEFIEHAKVQL
jgi:hypothetical protein